MTKELIEVKAIEVDVSDDLQAAMSLADMAVVIKTQEDYEKFGSTLEDIKARIKRIDDFRLEQTRPIMAAKKNIDDIYKGPVDKLKQAKGNVETGMKGYLAAERKRQEAEAEKARKAAEAEAEKERERLRKEAEAEAAKETERLRKEAEAKGIDPDAIQEVEAADIPEVEVELPPVEYKAPQASGVNTAKTWKGKVVDLGAVPKETLIQIMKLDQGALDSLARRTKGQLEIKGIIFYEDDQFRSQRRR